MSNIIQVQNLTKIYGSYKAVDNLNFSVEKGSIFAFLGENGAGKSTTISCLTTLLSATSGVVKIDGAMLGENDAHIRQIIGVVFQESLLDNRLTVKENLKIRGKLYSLKNEELKLRISELSSQLALEDFLNKPYGRLSGGQRRRVDIARALIHKPKILFLDEPTSQLDPLSRMQVWEAVKKLREEDDLTVFLTTHYMEEVENADHVLILDKGKTKAFGTPLELKRTYAPNILTLFDKNGRETIMTVENSNVALEFLNENNESYIDFEFRHGRMDDVFLNVTQKKERN